MISKHLEPLTGDILQAKEVLNSLRMLSAHRHMTDEEREQMKEAFKIVEGYTDEDINN